MPARPTEPSNLQRKRGPLTINSARHNDASNQPSSDLMLRTNPKIVNTNTEPSSPEAGSPTSPSKNISTKIRHIKDSINRFFA
ncbi:hypothetical protein BCR33DRAFT_717532 [Rhizoclosmatium globosum]|uniref:Uncharacterized protein n=1 Tax=Rhizoclosmatium globosum TaxID=329046 RepID=A0A1Y2C8D0_9FUNG|nr:hypothetical protein BCR33DRAFT_717532 [Rhizoclosmatium globosum]|eukprot:ORY43291.1 hypothetical protein BCR33DRAFT_717532 [Rhizoclosmatium globosum]